MGCDCEEGHSDSSDKDEIILIAEWATLICLNWDYLFLRVKPEILYTKKKCALRNAYIITFLPSLLSTFSSYNKSLIKNQS